MYKNFKVMKVKNDIKVSICISTYNHENYIEEALSSVCNQEFDFGYEIILSNDCSTDNTHSIILEFVKNHSNKNRIKYFNQETNLGIKENLIFTLSQASGVYIALLEGDDYWLDKKKLHKQYDFLEINKSYSMCTGGLRSYIPDVGYVDRLLSHNSLGSIIELKDFNDFRPNYLNMFFRKTLLNLSLLKEINYVGDNVVFLILLFKGKGYFFNEIFGFRRTHEAGLWTSKSKKERLLFDYFQLSEMYKINEFKEIVRKRLFFVSLDILIITGTAKYQLSALRLIRKREELVYFSKVVANYYKLQHY